MVVKSQLTQNIKNNQNSMKDSIKFKKHNTNEIKEIRKIAKSQ